MQIDRNPSFVLLAIATILLESVVAGCASEKLHPVPVGNTGSFKARPAADPTLPEDMPYRVDGITYYPLKNVENFVQSGIASWYGPKFHGKRTSNKEVYDMHGMTAAHKTLPFGTRVRVHNLENNKTVVVRINDRGPFVKGRIIDMSYRAGLRLGMVDGGTARVKVVALGNQAPGRASTPRRVSNQPDIYTVQIGVFQDRNNARRMAGSIQEGRVQSFDRAGKVWYRVVTGRYNSFERATQTMDHLRAQGRQGAYVILDLDAKAK